MEFNYTIESKNDIIIVSPTGDLIEKNQAKELMDELELRINGGANKIILSMENLKYINSVGLNVFINLLTKSRNQGSEVVISTLSKKVKDLFLITKLNSVFTVTENMEEALDFFENNTSK
jgi:anti-sigma B factor antagonist